VTSRPSEGRAGRSAANAPAFREVRRRVELTRVLRRRRRLRVEIVQLIFVAVAVALGVLLPRLQVGFTIPSGRAVEILISVAAGTVAFIGIVFSLLFVVVQFSATTFTPRLNLFRDAPIVWRSFSYYAAVVVYSFTAALIVGGSETTSGFVPLTALIGVLLALVVYRRLQTTAFRSIQLASTLAEIAERGTEVIDGLYVEPLPDDGSATEAAGIQQGGRSIRWRREQATLQVIDVPAVLAAAEAAGGVVSFTVGAGDVIFEGSELAVVGPGAGADVEDAVLAALTTGQERTFEQDPTLALRLLADISMRALSSAVNDPTTAVQAIDAMDGLLRRLAVRDLEIGEIRGEDGRLRVVLVLPDWDYYLAVALDDVTSVPVVPPSVSTRIRRLLDDLAGLGGTERAPAVERYGRRMTAGG
jgi:uncharacterized membrane protein